MNFSVSVCLNKAEVLPILEEGNKIPVVVRKRFLGEKLNFSAFLTRINGEYRFGYTDWNLEKCQFPNGTIGYKITEKESFYEMGEVEEWGLLSDIHEEELEF